jgi:molecular chaperone HscA
VEGRRLIEATRSALNVDSSLLSREELDGIERAIAELETLLGGSDHRAIRHAADALNRATGEFAARRMDEGIRRALAGRQIGSL